VHERINLLSADRYARGTLVALVILASLGTGFLASRLWPLPASPAPTLEVTSSDATVHTHDSPSKQFAVRSASRALAVGNAPSAKTEPVDVTENSAGAPFVLLNPDTADQPREVEESTQRSTAESPDESADQRKRPTRSAAHPREEKVPSPRLARGQRKDQASTNLAQPSPGPTGYQRDAAMRDFMSHNPPFRH
jgi:hypothetical protein